MREYHYPDFMPRRGELILVRDSESQDWRTRTFHKYNRNAQYPWYTRTMCGVTAVWKYAAPYSAMSEPVLYTEEDQPMPGQPILARDHKDADWECRIFWRYDSTKELRWYDSLSAGWRYAAHYDEQFWLAQQKKEEEPVDASKQAERLAEVLANNCITSYECGCMKTKHSCPFSGRPCRQITKDDWLAWAAKQED